MVAKIHRGGNNTYSQLNVYYQRCSAVRSNDSCCSHCDRLCSCKGLLCLHLPCLEVLHPFFQNWVLCGVAIAG